MTLAVAILMLVGTVYLFSTMPTGFIPSQDSGFMFAATLGPQDMSFDYMARRTPTPSARSFRAQPGSRRTSASSCPARWASTPASSSRT